MFIVLFNKSLMDFKKKSQCAQCIGFLGKCLAGDKVDLDFVFTLLSTLKNWDSQNSQPTATTLSRCCSLWEDYAVKLRKGKSSLAERSLTWKSSLTCALQHNHQFGPTGRLYLCSRGIWMCLDLPGSKFIRDELTSHDCFPVGTKKTSFFFFWCCKAALKPASTLHSLCYKCTVNTQRTAACPMHDRGSANDQEPLYNMRFLPSKTQTSASETDVALYSIDKTRLQELRIMIDNSGWHVHSKGSKGCSTEWEIWVHVVKLLLYPMWA